MGYTVVRGRFSLSILLDEESQGLRYYYYPNGFPRVVAF